MLKKYITPLLLAFAGYGLNAQCPPGDVILSSQAEVDAFVADYPNCTEIAGNMGIGSLSSIDPTNITDLSGLSSLISIGGFLSIGNNEVLTSLTGLEQLNSIGGFLYISNNDALTSLTGLEQLNSIGGDLRILRNAGITSLTGLEQLASIGGFLEIRVNAVLTSLTGLEQLASIGGFLSIGSNEGLTSLTGLEQLSSIGGFLSIGSNEGLTSLTGLEQLTSIGSLLSIRNNDALTSLTGLEQLSYIGSFLSIGGNDALNSLTGLENLDANTIADLRVENNLELSICAIESICNYLGVETNTADISGNATGCATREEVETACMVPATDISQTNIELFPNPTNGMLQLRNITAKEVVIYTAQGQRIARYGNPGQELNLSALPAGVYHLHLITADAVFAARVMKQ
ncbi:T9SS type A sorting domain-containing protein [Phaeodactylibacter xiamenensis]|uniref:T9SS type A sorting domain-containing protein n=1 Tax=Phaeodactylibacter xiamenensis TaxID=1524460 RepID=UPI003CCBF390